MIRSISLERDIGDFFIRWPVLNHHTHGEEDNLEPVFDRRKRRFFNPWKIFGTSGVYHGSR